MTSEEIIKMILGSLGTLVCLVIAIKWLDKDRNGLVKALTEERDGRISLIEESNRQCVSDRLALHAELKEQRREIKAMLTSMIPDWKESSTNRTTIT